MVTVKVKLPDQRAMEELKELLTLSGLALVGREHDLQIVRIPELIREERKNDNQY